MLTFPSTLNCKNASRVFLNGELENGFVCIVDESGSGSCLRDNALTQPATVHDPVNVVRHGRSEQFFPVGRSGAASESSWGKLAEAWFEIGAQWVSPLTP